MRPDHGGMHAGGLCSQRCQDGRWTRGGLYPTHYRRYATTTAGHQGFAANRPTGRDGVQAAKSELRKGRRGEPADAETVGHVEVLVSRRNGVCVLSCARRKRRPSLTSISRTNPDGNQRPSCSRKMRREGSRPTWRRCRSCSIGGISLRDRLRFPRLR
jgi:hypothetical protein